MPQRPSDTGFKAGVNEIDRVRVVRLTLRELRGLINTGLQPGEYATEVA
jgi:hypothetical protein